MATVTKTRQTPATATGIGGLVKSIFSERLRSVDIEQAIKESIKAHDDEISDLNTEQMNQGVKSDGTDIGVYANYSYKGRLSPVDLRDTGDFHNSVFTEVFEDAFDMSATDPKTAKLTTKYGDEILGLTNQNIQITGEIIRPTMVEKVREQL